MTKTSRIRRTRPKPPLGKYPQLLLCDHLGSAPTHISINTTSRIVPMTVSSSPVVSGVRDQPMPILIGLVLRSLAPPPIPLHCTHLFHMDYAKPDPLRSSGGPDTVSSLLKRVVGGDAALKPLRRHRRQTHDISERLHWVGWGVSLSGALEPELLDAGLEAGGLRSSSIRWPLKYAPLKGKNRPTAYLLKASSILLPTFSMGPLLNSLS
jgi:hypothetical protein